MAACSTPSFLPPVRRTSVIDGPHSSVFICRNRRGRRSASEDSIRRLSRISFVAGLRRLSRISFVSGRGGSRSRSGEMIPARSANVLSPATSRALANKRRSMKTFVAKYYLRYFHSQCRILSMNTELAEREIRNPRGTRGTRNTRNPRM